MAHGGTNRTLLQSIYSPSWLIYAVLPKTMILEGLNNL